MKSIYKSFAALLLLAVPLIGCSPKNAPASASGDTGPIPVQVAAATLGEVEDVAGITGKLAPLEEVEIAPKISGKISNLKVSMGQQVKKGDLLFTLDQSDLNNNVRLTEAQYESAVAGLNNAQNNADQSIIQAQNDVEKNTQALADAKQNEQRTAALYDSGAVPKQQLEQAQSALKNAQLAYDNATTALANAQKKSALQVSEASVNQAKVSLENAQGQISNASVTAPISGVVAMVNRQTGEMASPQSPVLTIVDISSLLVKASLSEQEVTQVKLGDHVQVVIPAVNKEVTASVKSLSPTMDPQLKAYPMEILISNDKGVLKPDMVVNVKLRAATGKVQAIVVPRQAVFDEGGKSYVYKLLKNTVEKLEVKTGVETSDKIEVKSGLSDKDQVVIAGQSLLHDGAKVSIQ